MLHVPISAYCIATGGARGRLNRVQTYSTVLPKIKFCYLVGIYPISSYILQLAAIYAGAKNFPKCRATMSNRERMHMKKCFAPLTIVSTWFQTSNYLLSEC